MPVATYREFVERLWPTVFQGDWGVRFSQTVAGTLADAVMNMALQAVKARMFGSDTFPQDALPPLGQERLMPKYPSETFSQYRVRLEGAWEMWQAAGTVYGVIKALEAYGLSNLEIKQNHDWDWDGDSANWSRFWVVIRGHSLSPLAWGGFAYGPGVAWGSSAIPEEVRAVRSIVRLFKPGHTVCDRIIVVFDETTWDAEQPDGTWDVAANRSASAVYWLG